MAEALTAPLKNKRLSQGDRDTLMSFAKKQVEATQTSDALDAAYNAAADVVQAAVLEKYPHKDMKVLERYSAASPDDCIYVTRSQYDYDRFTFRKDDKRIPLVPGGNCNRSRPLMLEGEARAVYDAFRDAEKAHKDAVKARVSDYQALVAGSRTFNEIATVWPAAEALRESIVGTGTALRVLSEDVVARIQRDAAATLAQAA